MIEKIAAALFLAIETLLFAMLPYFYSKISNEKMIRIFNCFSAGLFLGMAFLHILPEGNEAISNFFANHNQLPANQHQNHNHNDDTATHTHHQHQLPYGSLIAIITFLTVLTLETSLSNPYNNYSYNEEYQALRKKQNDQYQIDRIKQTKRQVFLGTYLAQIAIAIHSFFQCMIIGIEKDSTVVVTLAIAIMFHKWAQSLTLGFSYLEANMLLHTAFKFSLFHAFLNVAAILLGYHLSQSNQLLRGVAFSISAGTFLFMSIAEKISQEFHSKEGLLKKFGLVCVGLAFSILILQ